MWGAFLGEPFPSGFDAAFFSISPAEARALDPQQRLLLEVGWRALESAGLAIAPDSGLPVGVFVAQSTSDYQAAKLWRPGFAEIDPFTATGASPAAAAGRLSYSFGFHGPSLTVDTACSSSLVAVHLACQALERGECEAALVAGVNALLAPNLYVALGKMGLMSPDGRCRPFDAAANGYVRAEGCGAVVLKPLRQARRDGDRILALCRGSAVNHDGRTPGLTAPNGAAQERVIGLALARAKLEAADIDYVEAHGTGTPLGDMIELNALARTYAQGRTRSAPLIVGSVKSNIGHLEAGAGMAGLIKTVLCLQHGEIPAHLHLRQPTPHLNWRDTALEAPATTIPWPAGDRAPLAAVSAFGFSGTNAHLILEAAPAPAIPDGPAPDAVILPISARTPAALRALAGEFAAWLEREPRPLVDVAFTLGAGRTAFPHRQAVVGGGAAELAAALRTGQPQSSGDPVRAKLIDLASAWTGGASVDWARLYRPYGARITTAPGHPFHPQRHWPTPSGSGGGLRNGAARHGAPQDRSPATIEAWRRLIDETARGMLSDQPALPLDPDQALAEQGLTSLLGLELQRHLEALTGRPAPAGLIYNYPSINRLAAFFADAADPDPDPLPVVPPPPVAAGMFDFLDTLSDEDLARHIEREVSLL